MEEAAIKKADSQENQQSVSHPDQKQSKSLNSEGRIPVTGQPAGLELDEEDENQLLPDADEKPENPPVDQAS
jgi:hypothetical protein